MNWPVDIDAPSDAKGARLLNDIRHIAAQPEGRRLLKTLLIDACCLLDVAEPGLGVDYLQKHEGIRTVGVSIKSWLDQIDPKLFTTIISEE